MRFRWTKRMLELSSDDLILRHLVSERKSDLHPYSILSQRLNQIHKNLDAKIDNEKQEGDYHGN